MQKFFAIDVETANPSMASICQIGLVGFEAGQEFFAKSWIIDPDDWFDPINVSIHGISEHDVAGAPKLDEIFSQFVEITAGQILVCHTNFDRSALNQAFARYNIEFPECSWLDSARVARRAWEAFSQRGYGLANLASHLGIEFKHHDAEEDARAAGQILVRAISESGINLEDWFSRINQPVSGYQSVQRSGDGDGALVGEAVVFTGALVIPRREAADRAANAGADVQTVVTKTTTVLVVGDQDISKLAGKSKSSKHLKAEELISSGQDIRILGESDFLALSAITE